jgi:hypothetical protein
MDIGVPLHNLTLKNGAAPAQSDGLVTQKPFVLGVLAKTNSFRSLGRLSRMHVSCQKGWIMEITDEIHCF